MCPVNAYLSRVAVLAALILASVGDAEAETISVRVSASGTAESWGSFRTIDTGIKYQFAYDPAGPCWQNRVAPSNVPTPAACPPGYADAGVGATTASCPNGACICTNWMDCAQRDQVPWGCSGSSTPWLPLKIRKCVASTSPAPLVIHMKPTMGTLTIAGLIDGRANGIEISGSANVGCTSPGSNIGQNQSIDYGVQAGSMRINIERLISGCTSIPFDSVGVDLQVTAKLPNGTRMSGPKIVLQMSAKDIMHAVTLRFSGIDDDAYVWIGGPSSNQNAICSASIGSGGSGQCSLTSLMRGRGTYSESDFTIKFGNGGGWNGCGNAELLIDGHSVWQRSKNCVVRHTGWFLRSAVHVDFLHGTVRVIRDDACNNVTDCMN